MRLSILNYGLDLNSEIPKYAVKEDEAILKVAEEIVIKHSFGKGGLLVAEVMHTGLRNFNNRKYMEKGMENSAKTFYSPHPTPFLLHHDSGESGNKLISVGSNIHSEFIKRRVETATGPATGYVKVATFIPENAMLSGQKAIDVIRSRQLFSLSIGARVSDENYICSICGKSVYDSECDHIPGRLYEGKTCEAHVYNPLFREYSGVYNPSDINAAIRRMDLLEGENADADKEFVVDCAPSLTGYAHVYEGMGTKIYTTGGTTTNEKAGDSMGKTDTGSQELSGLSELIAKFTKESEDAKNLINTLATQLGEKIDSINTLNAELESVKNDMETVKKENTAVKEESEQLKGKITSLEAELADAKKVKDTDQSGGDNKTTEKTDEGNQNKEKADDPSKQKKEGDASDPGKTSDKNTKDKADIRSIVDKALGKGSLVL